MGKEIRTRMISGLRKKEYSKPSTEGSRHANNVLLEKNLMVTTKESNHKLASTSGGLRKKELNQDY